jgi:predicted dehydrogenase
VVRTPGHNQIVQMLEDFSQAVLGKVPVQPGPEEAIRTLRVMDALARSAQEGQPIEV